MPKKRYLTNEIISRVNKVDRIVSEWMRQNRINEIDPEGCMEILVKNEIYKYDSKGRGHHFREDLRTLRDCNRLDIFSSLLIEQTIPGSRWWIKLRT
ncbi:MAG: hypothetical protein PWP71_1724 [Clostridia bacterium]|jgi:hypothetical protein|nr:hypothetical protein [Clostridia bacterium]